MAVHNDGSSPAAGPAASPGRYAADADRPMADGTSRDQAICVRVACRAVAADGVRTLTSWEGCGRVTEWPHVMSPVLRTQRAISMQSDLSHLGTPQIDRVNRFRLALRVMGPALLLPLAWIPMHLRPLHEALGSYLPQPMVAVVVMLIAVAIIAGAFKLMRGTRALSEQEAFEPLFNGQAVGKLRTASSSLLPMAAGEHVVETFMLLRLAPMSTPKRGLGSIISGPAAMCWVVWTNQSVRIFKVGRSDCRMDLRLDLAEISALSKEASVPNRAGVSAWMTHRLGGYGWLEISLHDGKTIAGAVQSPTVVERVIRRFQSGNA